MVKFWFKFGLLMVLARTLKPMVDSGAEWDMKRCEIRSATAEVKTGLLKTLWIQSSGFGIALGVPSKTRRQQPRQQPKFFFLWKIGMKIWSSLKPHVFFPKLQDMVFGFLWGSQQLTQERYESEVVQSLQDLQRRSVSQRPLDRWPMGLANNWYASFIYQILGTYTKPDLIFTYIYINMQNKHENQ